MTEQENNNDQVYSYHTFMFPFIFSKKDKTYITSGWDFVPYEGTYNEKSYFHSFFNNAMFSNTRDGNSSLYHKEEFNNSEFEIVIEKSKYVLNLERVDLKLFNTNVGILSFHIKNMIYSNLQDILRINDFARRVYPEYLDEKLTCSLVPTSVTIRTKNQNISEDFTYKSMPNSIVMSKIIQALLPSSKIKPAIDDRMFVISFVQNHEWIKNLQHCYTDSDLWYQYIYVDGNNKNIANDEMQTKMLNDATYARWLDEGTLYGISRYSFVCASVNDFPLQHLQTVYFQMFNLLLMIRASVLKFSDDVAIIAEKLDDHNIGEKVTTLYKEYIEFVNRFYFREVTPKEQGIELYERAVFALKIERDVKDLDGEIAELFHYNDMGKQSAINNNMAKLSEIGVPLMVAGLIAGIFGMNTIDFNVKNNDSVWGVISSILIFIGLFVSPFMISKFFKNKGIK